MCSDTLMPLDRWRWLVPVAGLVLSAVASLICLNTAGALQGTMFGACIAVVLLAPTLVSATNAGALLPAATTLCISVGALAGPALGVARGELTTPLFLAAAGVVPALAIAAAGLTLLLTCLRVNASVAAWIVTVALLAWLAWPIWFSPWIADHLDWVPAMSAPHPLLTLDAALLRDHVRPWIQATLMYGPPSLTRLGEQAFYVPPPTIWPAVGCHLGVAVPGFALATWIGRKGPGRGQGM
jgi:hypothetical protein